MEIIKALKTRRSVRKFKEKPVKDEKINKIINTARLAPSGHNYQPVEYIVIKDQDKRNEIADIATNGNFIAEAPVCIVVCSERVEHDIEDGSAATENILLASHGLGLASCWVAGYKKDYCAKIEDLLNIPDDYRLISLLPIGHPAEKSSRPDKRDLEEVLHRENF